MHAYDVPSRRSSFSPVPSARAAQDSSGGHSATPIYDSVYTEWLKSFRALPGDRSGEEELKFTAFGIAPHTTGAHGTSTYDTGAHGSHAYTAYSAGAYSARHGTGQQQVQWQRVGSLGRHENGMHHVPAALPPGPRRGT
ncbi:hypothetical protein [Streptomyces sp. NPDC102462]|uniref:hypothetical protein n=1 Tax=Streptomyces sp. NPDC102462 TaxID=3366178 RepID=UPI0037F1BB6F